MLVESHQFAQRFWGEPLRHNRIGWAIAFEDSMWNQPVRRALRLHLLGCLTEGKSLSLGENVGKQHVVMPAKPIKRLDECDEVARDKPRPLMDQLVKRVLSVCARLSPVDRTSVAGDGFPIECDVFAVALHRQLLEI